MSIEDGMAENDWDGWKLLTERIGDRCQLVGDDLFCTNSAILAKGIEQDVANAILVKVNQIGTLTETLEAIELARAAGYNSHHLASLGRNRGHVHRRSRRGDAGGADQDRVRRRARDRVAKYNQLLRIEEQLERARRVSRRRAVRPLAADSHDGAHHLAETGSHLAAPPRLGRRRGGRAVVRHRGRRIRHARPVVAEGPQGAARWRSRAAQARMSTRCGRSSRPCRPTTRGSSTSRARSSGW